MIIYSRFALVRCGNAMQDMQFTGSATRSLIECRVENARCRAGARWQDARSRRGYVAFKQVWRSRTHTTHGDLGGAARGTGGISYKGPHRI